MEDDVFGSEWAPPNKESTEYTFHDDDTYFSYTHVNHTNIMGRQRLWDL